MTFSYSLHKGTGSGPRLGTVSTANGTFDTPVFMPVGTQAAVKALAPNQVGETGSTIILANTYHLYLRPGSGVVARQGGLHKFMGWHGPILTDSGGFQVFSLSSLRKITEDGVTFKSHIDGSTHFIGPEESISIQHDLGADIIMCFDECTKYPATHEIAEASMTMMHVDRVGIVLPTPSFVARSTTGTTLSPGAPSMVVRNSHRPDMYRTTGRTR